MPPFGTLDQYFSPMGGGVAPGGFAGTPTGPQDQLAHLMALLEQAKAPEPPQQIPVPNQPGPGPSILGGLSDALRAGLAARGAQLPGEDYASTMRDIMARRQQAQAYNQREQGRYATESKKAKAGAEAKVLAADIENKQRGQEKQAALDERKAEQQQRLAEQEAERTWKAQQEEKDRTLRQTISDSEGRIRLQVAAVEHDKQPTPDKVAARQMAEEQRKLLQEAKEGAIVVKNELPARLERGETKQQIRERFMDQLDAMGLEGDARAAADAFFELKLGNLLYEDQGPAQEPPRSSPPLSYGPYPRR